MGDSWRIGVEESDRTELVTGGVFGLVRNPIYTGMIPAFVGIALLVPNPVALAAFVPRDGRAGDPDPAGGGAPPAEGARPARTPSTPRGSGASCPASGASTDARPPRPVAHWPRSGVRTFLITLAAALRCRHPPAARRAALRPAHGDREERAVRARVPRRRRRRRAAHAHRQERPAGKYGALGYSFDLRVPVVNNAFFGYEIQAEGKTVWFHATQAARRPQRRAGHAGARPGHRRPARPPARGRAAARRERRDHHRVADRARVGAARRPRVALGRLVPGGPQGALPRLRLALERRRPDRQPRLLLGRGGAVRRAASTTTSVRRMVPGFTFPTGPTTTNFPIPWMVSTPRPRAS